MTRPVTRVDNPPAWPNRCIICGHGVGPYREFFLDLGFDITTEYQPLREGAVYLCNLDAAAVADQIIKVLNDHQNAVMDNVLVKEEASYGLIDGIAGRSELSDVSESESSRPVLERVTDRGVIQGMDSGDNLPDAHVSPSPPADSRFVIPTEPDNPETPSGEGDSSLSAPVFRMGRRIDTGTGEYVE